MANNIYFEKLELEDTFKEWRDKLNNLILNLSDVISIDNISITRNENEELQVTDVIVSSLAGKVKASDYGQIGDAKLVSGVDLNTLVVSGNYIASSAAGSYDLNYPSIQSGWTLIRVDRYSNIVKQTVYQGAYLIWVRYSDDSGASWKAWQPIGGSFYSSYSIYISKSGSDTNTGLDKEHPVLTINRAMHIAATLLPTPNSPYINFYLGEGNWGDVTFTRLPYRLRLRPYSGEANEYSDSLPKFGTLSSLNSHVTIYGVNANILDANECGFLSIISYNRCAMIRARNGGIVYIAGSNNPVEIKSTSSHSSVFSSYSGGFIDINGERTINIIENLNLSGGVVSISNDKILGLSKLTFSVADGVSVIGKKYSLSGCADVDVSKSFLDALPGSENGIIRGGVSIDGIPYGGGDTHTFLAADGTFKKDSDSIYAKDIAIEGDESDLASARGQIGKVETITNANINTIIKSGCYCCRGITSNAPNGNGIGFLIVYSQEDTNGVFVSQLFILHTGNYNAYFTRNSSSNGENWTNWNRIIDSQSSIGNGITVNNGIISVPEYEGATASKAGTSGLVPPAATNEINYALCGDGTFKSFLPTSGGSLNGVLNMNNNNIENINHIKFSNNGELWIE